MCNYNRELGQDAQLLIGTMGIAYMPKFLCLFGAVVAVLLLLVFVLDLAIKVPFGRVNLLMDVGFVICSGMLGYLSWMTLREQK